MDASTIKEVSELAQHAARKIGQEIVKRCNEQSPFEVNLKGPTDVVTEVDLWAEEEITRFVNQQFPDHIIVGEEQSSKLATAELNSLETKTQHGVCWIVDPIDGTSNFVNRIPHSSVSLGILEDGVRQVGVVFDPYRNEMYTATKNGGAYLNGKTIHVSSTSLISHAIVASSFGEDKGELSTTESHANQKYLAQARAYRRFGSAALDLCWVASGRLDAAFEAGLAAWDAAAGTLIVEEAGGVVCNFGRSQNQSLNLFSKLFFAANPKLHQVMLKMQHAD